MQKRYEQFLKEFDNYIAECRAEQNKYLYCKEGCTECCEIGEYPFSRLEMEYIMSGFIRLSPDVQNNIKANIKELAAKKNKIKPGERYEYRCPFLLDKLCTLYEYRGIVCRVFGLAYLDNFMVRVPECANSGLNYADVYDKKSGTIQLDNPIKDNLRTDIVLRGDLAKKFELECGEIRRLINWFS